MYKEISLDLTAPNDAVILSAATRTAGSQTLVGSVTSLSLGGLRQLVATTVADETALGNTMVITGTAMGVAVTETLTLPNASTVTSTKYFDTITDVTTTQNDAGNTKLGTNQIEVSEWFLPKLNVNVVNIGLAVNISGTINYDVEYTMSKNDLDFSNAPALVFDHDAIAAETTDQAGNIVVPVVGIRLRTNTFTAGATATMHIIQSEG